MSITITFTIPGKEAPMLKDRIKEEATRQGLSVSEWIVEACAEYLRSRHEA